MANPNNDNNNNNLQFSGNNKSLDHLLFFSAYFAATPLFAACRTAAIFWHKACVERETRTTGESAFSSISSLA